MHHALCVMQCIIPTEFQRLQQFLSGFYLGYDHILTFSAPEDAEQIKSAESVPIAV